jgi:hypothetical protein
MLDIHISTAAQELNARLDKGWADSKIAARAKIPPFSLFSTCFYSVLFSLSPYILFCFLFCRFLGDLEGFELFLLSFEVLTRKILRLDTQDL